MYPSEQRRKAAAHLEALKAEALSICDAADKDNKGELTKEQQARFDEITAELNELEKPMGRRTPAPKPASPYPKGHRGEPRPGQPAIQMPPSGIGASFADLFPEASQDTGGFDSFGEFAALLHQGVSDDRLVPTAATGNSSGGASADGGYLIPPAFVAGLMDASLEDEIVRPRARIMRLEHGHARMAGFNTQDHSANIGGFQGKWMEEGETFTAQKGILRSILLKAKKLGILTAATNELVADSPFFEEELLKILVNAITFYMDDAFLTGDGTNQPRGVLNDSALITVAKESGQAAETITFNNLKAMLNRLHPASMRDAVWVASTTTREQLLGLVQHVRNEGDTDNVGGTWVPAMRETPSGGWRILGLPVEFTEKVPAVGAEGDILLADFRQYQIALSAAASIARSGDHYFDSDETAYRAIMRADGLGRWSDPVTPKNGDTLSWCVTLAERA